MEALVIAVILLLGVPFLVGMLIGYFVGRAKGRKQGAELAAAPYAPPPNYRPLTPEPGTAQPGTPQQSQPGQLGPPAQWVAPPATQQQAWSPPPPSQPQNLPPQQQAPLEVDRQPPPAQDRPPAFSTPPGPQQDRNPPSYSPQASPVATAEPAKPAPRDESRTINIALYIGGLVLTVAALAFVALIQNPVLTATSLTAAFILFAAVGYWLAVKVAMLKPAGLALFGTSLALLAVAAIPIDQAFIQRPTLTWLLVSAVGMLVYGTASIRLDSQVLGYLAVPFLYSTVVSATASLQQPMVWTLSIILVVSAVMNTLVFRLGDRVPAILQRPFKQLHWMVGPAVLMAALLQVGALTAGNYALIFTAAGLYYSAAALKPPQPIFGYINSIAARLLLSLALLSLLQSVAVNLGVQISVLSLWLALVYVLISQFPWLTGLRGEQQQTRPQIIRYDLIVSILLALLTAWWAQVVLLTGHHTDFTYLWAGVALLAAAITGGVAAWDSKPAATASIRGISALGALSLLVWEPIFALIWLLLWAAAELLLSAPPTRARWHRGLLLGILTVLGWTVGYQVNQPILGERLALLGALGAAIGVVIFLFIVCRKQQGQVQDQRVLLWEAMPYGGLTAVTLLMGTGVLGLSGWPLAIYSAVGIAVLYAITHTGLHLLAPLPTRASLANAEHDPEPVQQAAMPLAAAMPGLEQLRMVENWRPTATLLRLVLAATALLLTVLGAAHSWFTVIDYLLWPRLYDSDLPTVTQMLPGALLTLTWVAAELFTGRRLGRDVGNMPQSLVRQWVPLHVAAHAATCVGIAVLQIAVAGPHLLWLIGMAWAVVAALLLVRLGRSVSLERAVSLDHRGARGNKPSQVRQADEVSQVTGTDEAVDLRFLRGYAGVFSLLVIAVLLSGAPVWWIQVLLGLAAAGLAWLLLRLTTVLPETWTVVPALVAAGAWISVSGVGVLLPWQPWAAPATASILTTILLALIALTRASAKLPTTQRGWLRLVGAALVVIVAAMAVAGFGHYLRWEPVASALAYSAVTIVVALAGLYAILLAWSLQASAASPNRTALQQNQRWSPGTLVRGGVAGAAILLLILGNDLPGALGVRNFLSEDTGTRVLAAVILLVTGAFWALAELLTARRISTAGGTGAHRWTPVHLSLNAVWLAGINLLLTLTGLSTGLWWFTAVAWAVSSAAFLRAAASNAERNDRDIGLGYALAVALIGLVAPVLAPHWWVAVAAMIAVGMVIGALLKWGPAQLGAVAMPILTAWAATQLVRTVLWAGHDAQLWNIHPPAVGYLAGFLGFLAVGAVCWRPPARFAQIYRRCMGVTAAIIAGLLSLMPLVTAAPGYVTVPGYIAVLAWCVPLMHVALIGVGLKIPALRTIAGLAGALVLPVSCVMAYDVGGVVEITGVSLMLLAMLGLVLLAEWLILPDEVSTPVQQRWVWAYWGSAASVAVLMVVLGLTAGASAITQAVPLVAGALLLVLGMVRGRRFGVLFGAGLIVVSVLWALRGMMALFLVVLGALIIGAAIWRLVIINRRNPPGSSHTPAPSPEPGRTPPSNSIPNPAQNSSVAENAAKRAPDQP